MAVRLCLGIHARTFWPVCLIDALGSRLGGKVAEIALRALVRFLLGRMIPEHLEAGWELACLGSLLQHGLAVVAARAPARRDQLHWEALVLAKALLDQRHGSLDQRRSAFRKVSWRLVVRFAIGAVDCDPFSLLLDFPWLAVQRCYASSLVEGVLLRPALVGTAAFLCVDEPIVVDVSDVAVDARRLARLDDSVDRLSLVVVAELGLEQLARILAAKRLDRTFDELSHAAALLDAPILRQ
jgi:hypothetical protein